MFLTDEQMDFLKSNYPEKGKKWCIENMGLKESTVRHTAAKLGLKLDRNAEFYKEWQGRAAQSKVGKKRPDQALVMKNLHFQGKLALKDEQKQINSARLKKYMAENNHPKGSLGMKHTNEAKEKISVSSKRMWENMSEEKKNERSKTASINGAKVAALNRDGKTTWKAAWRNIGGIDKYYRSRWEANYARYLDWLKINHQIKDWKHEPKTFWFEGIKRGCVSYLPDFWILNNDNTEEYHEVKGWMDDRSKTKIKRMEIYFPKIKLIVIDAKLYKSIEKKAKFLVNNWE